GRTKITIGSPHHGLFTARLVIEGRDYATSNGLLEHLRRREAFLQFHICPILGGSSIFHLMENTLASF
ncbi:MAG TPA: hypothetical protein PLI12_07605, partial [Acetobacteraceae bacterium]|nr:hypothetical protein [Acetobacteraceae bacterium]